MFGAPFSANIFHIGKKTFSFTLVFLLIFTDFFFLLPGFLQERLPSSVNQAVAAEGDLAIFREASGGQIIPQTGGPISVTWDTAVQSNTNIPLAANGHDFTLTEGGKYFVSYNVWFDASDTNGVRRSADSWLELDGTPLAAGRGYGYVRNNSGATRGYAAGSAIIEADANDVLTLRMDRTDTRSEDVEIAPQVSGITILKLRDSFTTARITRSEDSGDISGDTTFSPVEYNVAEQVDTSGFAFTPTDSDIILKGSADTVYLVTANVGLNSPSGNVRQNYEMRLTLDGVEVPGSRTTGYIRSSDNTRDVTLVYSGLIKKNSSSDAVLRVEIRRESQDGQSTFIQGNKTGVTLLRLPASTQVAMLGADSGTQSLTNTRTPFTWFDQQEIGSSFSHNIVTNPTRLNILNTANYLLFSTAYSERASGSNREVPEIRWRLNGSTLFTYGGHASFNRGVQGSQATLTAGSSAVFATNALSSGDYIELTRINDATGSPVSQFFANRLSLQALDLSTLFETDVEVSVTGSQISTSSTPVSNQYLGGTFVIRENTSSRNVTNITISENGSVNAAEGITNVRLFYDLDTTAPYDCSGESFTGSESQFGLASAGGFSGPNGTLSFSGNVTISPTQSVCLYVVYDTTSAAVDGDSVSILINNPSTDILVSGGGLIGPPTSVQMSGVTTLQNPEVTQAGYHWRNDDGTETGATSASGGVENTSITGFAVGDTNRLRMSVANEGSIESQSKQFRLEYTERVGTCEASTTWNEVGASGAAFTMSSTANLTDGSDTTNIPVSSGGITNAGSTFITPNSGVRDTTNQTGPITLGVDEFVELEFAIEATGGAVDGTTYCFRVTDTGTPLRNYSQYAEGIVSADVLVATFGSHISTVEAGDTDVYIGGTFVVSRPGADRTLTSLEIRQVGTLNTAEYLSNPRLFYNFDSSAPYDCTSESFDINDSSLLGTAFSINGTSTFSTSETINATSSFCGYVVVDVSSSAPNGETIKFEINNPSTDVVVSASTVGPSSPVSPTASTTIIGQERQQAGYHWRNDDGTETGATSASGGVENTPILSVPKESTRRIRVSIANTGTITASSNGYRLEYGTKISTCALVGVWNEVGASGAAFTMSSTANLTDGSDTTNIPVSSGGITNAGSTFITPNSGVRDTTNQTGPITLGVDEFVELEFAIEATGGAAFSSEYCFRVTDDGMPLETYTEYPELQITERRDFRVQRGEVNISSTSTRLTAGVDYEAPTNDNAAFVRITNSSMTGAGRSSGGGTQSPSNVTVALIDAADLTDGFTLARFGSADDSYVAWELIEYIGVAGGDNEMQVRDRGVVTLTGAQANSSTVPGVLDDSDIVVFITGYRNPSTSAAQYPSGLTTSAWDGGNTQAMFTRDAANISGVEVSYAVVEFTGVNWNVQRIEHVYDEAGVIETASIAAVNSINRTFIESQKRTVSSNNSLNSYGHEVWLSSIGSLSLQLETGAPNPSDHTSVVWVVENTQFSDGSMAVYRSNGVVPNNTSVQPQIVTVSIGATVPENSTSLWINNRSSGGGTAFPRPILGATIVNDGEYRLYNSDGGQSQAYRTEVVVWPTADTSIRQTTYRFFVDNDELTPTEAWPPGPASLGENMSITQLDEPLGLNDRTRLRLALFVNNASLPQQSEAFRLQFGRRASSCQAITTWTDLGNPGSAEVWRGYNAAPISGTALSVNPPNTGDLLLSISDVAGTYEEQVQSAVNPFAVDVGQSVEFDWHIEHNGALQRSDYCFRVVLADGSPIDGYDAYPIIRTVGHTPVVTNWRWFFDDVNLNPLSPITAEAVAPINIENQEVVRLRIALTEIAGAPGENIKYALQFSEYADFSRDVHTLVATSTCEENSLWCYSETAASVNNNQPIDEVLLSGSNSCISGVGPGCGVYHTATSSQNLVINHQPFEVKEHEFILQHAGARVNAVYYFRLFDLANEEPVVASSSIPSLVTEGANLSFTVDGIAAGEVVSGNTLTHSTTPTTLSFSSLPLHTSQFGAHRLSVESNATEGHTVFILSNQDLSNSYGDVIQSISGTNLSPVSWAIGCDLPQTNGCFGYHTTDPVLANGSTRFSASDTFAPLTNSLAEVVYSPISGLSEYDILYRIEVNERQPAGNYQSDIMFVAVPVF